MLAEVPQLLVNGLVAGTILAVPAIGFTAIYAVLRFPNFTVASHLTIGAFAGYVANANLGLPAAGAVAAAFLVAGAVGVASDEAVLKPLRPAGALTAAIAAVALTIVLENVVRFLFGNDLRGYDLPIRRDWQVHGVRIGPQQVENLAIAVVAMAAVFLFLAFTRTGKAMRAVADNPTLADIKGINPHQVARLVNFVGMGLAGVGGMLVGLDTSIDPLTGFRVILSVFAAAVVGGLGSIPGAVVGALTVGVGEEMSLLVLAPAYRTAVGFAAILVVLTLRPRGYAVAMATFAGLYALLALGLNVVWGMTGMINLGLVGFFAFGAYVSALLTKAAGAPILVGLAAAAVLTAAAGVVMALTTARLRGDYLAIITLGFSEVVRLVASNEIWLTNGTDGISGIPGPWRGRVSPETFNLIFLGIVVLAVALGVAVTQRVRHSPYGRVLRAIRDDDQVASVAGKRVIAFKVEAFALSAAVLGLAGGLYGHYTSYIAPEAFVPLITIYIVLALTAGGTGNNWGAVAGAALVVFFMESTRFLTAWLPGLAPVQVAAVRELLIGLGLILVLRFRPAGLLPERIVRVPPAGRP